jgi:hypothetical protein
MILSDELSDSSSDSTFFFFFLFWASLLANAAALDASPFGMLDTSQIQEIQRIKIIITRISLGNVGEMQINARQRPGYKAAVL